MASSEAVTDGACSGCGAAFEPDEGLEAGAVVACTECAKRFRLLGFVVERIASALWAPVDEEDGDETTRSN